MNCKFLFLIFITLGWNSVFFAMEVPEFIQVVCLNKNAPAYDKRYIFNLHEKDLLLCNEKGKHPTFKQLVLACKYICVSQVSSRDEDGSVFINYYETNNLAKVMESSNPVNAGVMPVIYDPINGHEIFEMKSFNVGYQNQKVRIIHRINFSKELTHEKISYDKEVLQVLCSRGSAAIFGLGIIALLAVYAYDQFIEDLCPIRT